MIGDRPPNVILPVCASVSTLDRGYFSNRLRVSTTESCVVASCALMAPRLSSRRRWVSATESRWVLNQGSWRADADICLDRLLIELSSHDGYPIVGVAGDDLTKGVLPCPDSGCVLSFKAADCPCGMECRREGATLEYSVFGGAGMPSSPLGQRRPGNPCSLSVGLSASSSSSVSSLFHDQAASFLLTLSIGVAALSEVASCSEIVACVVSPFSATDASLDESDAEASSHKARKFPSAERTL